MKTLAMFTLLFLGTSCASTDVANSAREGDAGRALAIQEMPEPSPTLEEHQWLEQLVGEWTVTTEMSMGPGTAPMKMESTESVRSIGGLWIVGEGSASFAGQPFTSILTLGYDPDEKTFVGSWIDTMQTHMWTYTGELDQGRKVLTLSAEGPTFGDATKTSQYRDVIELKGPDHKVLTSSIENADGTWTTFMTADYRRKPK